MNVNFKVSNHHSSNDGQINETQELKSLLDSADQRNQEQEQVEREKNIFYFLIEVLSLIENSST